MFVIQISCCISAVYVSPQDPGRPEYGCLKVISPMSNPTSSLQDIFGSFTFLKMSSFLSSFPSPSSRKPASHRSCQSSVRPPSLPPHSSTTLLPQCPACGSLCPEPCEVGLLSGLPGLRGSHDVSPDGGPPSVAVCAPRALSCPQLLTPTSGLASFLTENTEHASKRPGPSAWALDPQ